MPGGSNIGQEEVEEEEVEEEEEEEEVEEEEEELEKSVVGCKTKEERGYEGGMSIDELDEEREKYSRELEERERLGRERLGRESLRMERLERERWRREGIESARLIRERQERKRHRTEAREEREGEERERQERERQEREGEERERQERERLGRESLRMERLERERWRREGIESARLIRERQERKRHRTEAREEREGEERERQERERQEREGEERERQERERQVRKNLEEREREIGERFREELMYLKGNQVSSPVGSSPVGSSTPISPAVSPPSPAVPFPRVVIGPPSPAVPFPCVVIGPPSPAAPPVHFVVPPVRSTISQRRSVGITTDCLAMPSRPAVPAALPVRSVGSAAPPVRSTVSQRCSAAFRWGGCPSVPSFAAPPPRPADVGSLSSPIVIPPCAKVCRIGAGVSEKRRRKIMEEDVEKLCAAAGSGDIKEATRLCDGGTDVNERGRDGKTPVWHAVDKDDLEMTEFLHSEGTRLTGLLPVAIRRRNVEMIRFLCSKRVNAIYAFKNAVKEKNLDVVKLLCEAGVCAKAREKSTLLHEAAVSGDLRMAQEILGYGANVLTKKDGKTASQLAEDSGHTDVAVYLRKQEQRILHPVAPMPEFRIVERRGERYMEFTEKEYDIDTDKVTVRIREERIVDIDAAEEEEEEEEGEGDIENGSEGSEKPLAKRCRVKEERSRREEDNSGGAAPGAEGSSDRPIGGDALPKLCMERSTVLSHLADINRCRRSKAEVLTVDRFKRKMEVSGRNAVVVDPRQSCEGLSALEGLNNVSLLPTGVDARGACADFALIAAAAMPQREVYIIELPGETTDHWVTVIVYDTEQESDVMSHIGSLIQGKENLPSVAVEQPEGESVELSGLASVMERTGYIDYLKQKHKADEDAKSIKDLAQVVGEVYDMKEEDASVSLGLPESPIQKTWTWLMGILSLPGFLGELEQRLVDKLKALSAVPLEKQTYEEHEQTLKLQDLLYWMDSLNVPIGFPGGKKGPGGPDDSGWRNDDQPNGSGGDGMFLGGSSNETESSENSTLPTW